MTARSLQVYTGRINERALFSRHPDLHLIIFKSFFIFNVAEGHVKSQHSVSCLGDPLSNWHLSAKHESVARAKCQRACARKGSLRIMTYDAN